jgi:TPR repeat protein
MFASGSLGAPNHREASKWYRKAAKAGDDEAQYNLGLMYIFGEGVKKNPNAGLRWLKAAAFTGNDVAEETLGQIYEKGAFGFHKNSRVALRWYRAAMSHGNNKAKFSLGLWLASKGTSKQKQEGAKLIRDAAKAGVVDAVKYFESKSGQCKEK